MKKIEQLGISPAPWITGEEDTTHLVLNKTDVYCKYTKKDGVKSERIVAIVNHWFAESEKDSKLISAAPELYEALAALLSCAEKEAPFTTDSRMSIAIDMARKAIEKAGGSE